MILKNSSCSMYFTQSSRKSPGKHRRTATSSAGGIKEAAAQHVARGRGPTPSGERTSTTRCYIRDCHLGGVEGVDDPTEIRPRPHRPEGLV